MPLKDASDALRLMRGDAAVYAIHFLELRVIDAVLHPREARVLS